MEACMKDDGDRRQRRAAVQRRKAAKLVFGCGRLDDYERLDGIGGGACGAVFRARDRRTGEIVAMKEAFDGMAAAALREVDILRSLRRHPNVVEFKEVAAEAADGSGGFCIMMEYVEDDLHRRYMEKKAEMRLSAAAVKSVMRQLLEGVKFLHDSGVMHRDLKPSNLLINGGGVVKICDFGMSGRIDAAAAGRYTAKVGTDGYRAPELLMGAKDYSEAVDMWAVGCIMAEMLLTYGGDVEARQRLETVYWIVASGDEGYDVLRSDFFPAAVVTGEGFDLLRRLLCWEAAERITAELALAHAWFDEE